MSKLTSAAAILAAQADAPPAYLGVAEVALASVTNYALGDDGVTIGVRGVDKRGLPVVVTFPADIAAVFISAIAQASAAAAKAREAATGDAIEQKMPITTPQSYHVAASKELDGVVLAFDAGTPHAAMFGLPLNGAMQIAQALANAAREQHAKKPRIVLPS